MTEFAPAQPLTEGDREKVAALLAEETRNETTRLLLRALGAERYWRELMIRVSHG